MPKPLHLIVACAENRVIGRERKLPWHIPEDLKYFHDTTAGQICVLGRICFETWPRANTEGRRPIVLTSHALIENRYAGENAPLVANSLTAALIAAEELPGEIYICGGERIYQETLALAGTRALRLHLTLIHADLPGDTFFPEWRHLAWQEVSRREGADAHYRYTFLTLDLPASG